MSALERISAAASQLKVFPLPSAVLFPSSALPLHIFEPRYRALVRDCLAQDRVMALAQLTPGWESDDTGRPAMHPTCCAGLLVWHEELADGRFNILLQGTVRARILCELNTLKPYREVQVELLEDAPYRGPEEELLRQALLDLASRLPPGAADSLLHLAAKTKGGALADVVAASLIESVGRRHALLCERDVGTRLREVLGDVGELLGQLAPIKHQGPLN